MLDYYSGSLAIALPFSTGLLLAADDRLTLKHPFTKQPEYRDGTVKIFSTPNGYVYAVTGTPRIFLPPPVGAQYTTTDEYYRVATTAWDIYPALDRALGRLSPTFEPAALLSVGNALRVSLQNSLQASPRPGELCLVVIGAHYDSASYIGSFALAVDHTGQARITREMSTPSPNL